MSEYNQTVLPASFIALFVAPGRHKPSATWADMAQRYDFCEDLASMLTEQAQTKLWELGVTEHDVLERMLLGLRAGAPVVSRAEAEWVVTRLAELLGWPALPASTSPPD